MAIEHVVFDIGRVLVHWDPEIPFRRLIADDAERTRFLAEVCSPAWNVEQDRGRMWKDAEAALIALYPGHADLIRAYRENWSEMVSHAYDGSVAIMRELIAAGVDVTLLTNWSAETFPEGERLYAFLKETRGVTVSGRVGLIKPDPEIFRLHETTFGLKPANTVFIDDSLKNVEAARAAGWQAILFQDAGRLREDLRALGLPLVAAE